MTDVIRNTVSPGYSAVTAESGIPIVGAAAAGSPSAFSQRVGND
jgi:hypothetical protein